MSPMEATTCIRSSLATSSRSLDAARCRSWSLVGLRSPYAAGNAVDGFVESCSGANVAVLGGLTWWDRAETWSADAPDGGVEARVESKWIVAFSPAAAERSAGELLEDAVSLENAEGSAREVDEVLDEM